MAASHAAPRPISLCEWLKEAPWDGAATIQSELGKLGAQIRVEDDIMIINPTGEPISYKVDSCNDHRIAMACAIYGLKLDQEIEISNAEAVNKSFPSFYDLLKTVIS